MADKDFSKFAEISKIEKLLEVEEIKIAEVIKLTHTLNPTADDLDEKNLKQQIHDLWEGSFFRKGIAFITREEKNAFDSLLKSLEKFGIIESLSPLKELEAKLLSLLAHPSGKISKELDKNVTDWNYLRKLCAEAISKCAELRTFIHKRVYTPLTKKDQEKAKLARYSYFDALLLIHPGFDLDTLTNPNYLANLKEVCAYFKEHHKPIFVMDDLPLNEPRVLSILTNTGYISLMKLVKLSKDYETLVQRWCIEMEKIIKKPREKIVIAIGGRYSKACVYGYSKPFFTNFNTAYIGKTKHEKPVKNALGCGYVLDEIV